MPSSHLNHQVRQWGGVQNGQNLIVVYKENIFYEQWHLIPEQIMEIMKNTILPRTFWRPFLDCMPRLFFRPKYVWFSIYLQGPVIPVFSGQFAELIVLVYLRSSGPYVSWCQWTYSVVNSAVVMMIKLKVNNKISWHLHSDCSTRSTDLTGKDKNDKDDWLIT